MNDSVDLRWPDHLVLAFDLGATTLFALEGATSAVLVRDDLFGILVVAFATALAGGIVIGSVPPAALHYTRYPLAAFAGGLLVFLFAHQVRQIPIGVMVALDAGGLSLAPRAIRTLAYWQHRSLPRAGF